MRVFVKTESMLEAVGLIHSFPDYGSTQGNPSANVQGVLFDTEDSLCYFVYDTENYQIDINTVSSIGLDKIKDILMGAESVTVSSGYAKLRRDIQEVQFEKEIGTLPFLDVEKIYLKIQPKSTPNTGIYWPWLDDMSTFTHGWLDHGGFRATPNTDSSLVGKVVTFEYRKDSRDCTARVVLVKDETDISVRGLDVLDDFKFKSFIIDKMENFKVVR